MPSRPADPASSLLRERISRQLQSGQSEAAEASLRELTAVAPHDAMAWLQLSRVMTGNGQWKAAAEPLLRALQNLPANAPLIMRLIQELMSRGEILAVFQCMDFLAQAPTPPRQLLREMAGVRQILGQYDAADALLQRALRDGADDPDTHFSHAMMRQFLGDTKGACHVLDRCLERWPRYSHALVMRVNLRRQTGESSLLGHVGAWADQITAAAAGGNEAAGLADAGFSYARFKILDDLGRREEAWSALQCCNRRMRAMYPYDALAEEALADALIDAPISPPRVSDLPQGPMPIFVVGMPRSGTTLLERILSTHSAVSSAGEIIEFQRQLRVVTDVPPGTRSGLVRAVERAAQSDLTELGDRYLRQTRWRAQGRAFYVDKLPANFRVVALIRRALPQARILHIMRDPMDVCFSNLKRLFGRGAPYSYAMESMAHYFHQYRRVVRHWQEVLPGAMLDVDYAELVNDTESSVRRILAHCGLEYEAGCLHPERNRAPVATPSGVQVREPIYQGGIGAWKAYAAHLQPMREALRAFGVDGA